MHFIQWVWQSLPNWIIEDPLTNMVISMTVNKVAQGGFILIGGCYALYTVGMAIATELDYRASNQKRDSAYDS